MKISRRVGLPTSARWSLRAVVVVAAIFALLSGGGSASAAPMCWQTWSGYQNYKTQYWAQLPQTKTQYQIADRMQHTEYLVQLPAGYQQWDVVDKGTPVPRYLGQVVTQMWHINMYQPYWMPWGDWSQNYYTWCPYAFGQYYSAMRGQCGHDTPHNWSDTYLCHLNDETWSQPTWFDYGLPAGHYEYQPPTERCHNNPPDYWQDYTTRDLGQSYTDWRYSYYGTYPDGTQPCCSPYYTVVGTYSTTVWGAAQWVRQLPSGRPGIDYIDTGARQTVFDGWGTPYWVDSFPAGETLGYDFTYGGVTQQVRTGAWQPAAWIDVSALSGTNGTNAFVNGYLWDGRTQRQVPDGIDRYAAQVPAGTYPTGKTEQVQVACQVRPT